MLKKELELLGLSTGTPGLSGEERFVELKSRLDAHQKTNEAAAEPAFVVPSLNHLAIAEIK